MTDFPVTAMTWPTHDGERWQHPDSHGILLTPDGRPDPCPCGGWGEVFAPYQVEPGVWEPDHDRCYVCGDLRYLSYALLQPVL